MSRVMRATELGELGSVLPGFCPGLAPVVRADSVLLLKYGLAKFAPKEYKPNPSDGRIAQW